MYFTAKLNQPCRANITFTFVLNINIIWQRNSKSEFRPHKNKQKINTIYHNNKKCTNSEVSSWNTKICKVYQTQGFYCVKKHFFKWTVWIFDRVWNNDGNFLATTPPFSTPSQVDESYPREKQPPPICCGIAASSRNCKRNCEWHADVDKLMSFTMRRLNPRRMVKPSLTL